MTPLQKEIYRSLLSVYRKLHSVPDLTIYSSKFGLAAEPRAIRCWTEDEHGT